MASWSYLMHDVYTVSTPPEAVNVLPRKDTAYSLLGAQNLVVRSVPASFNSHPDLPQYSSHAPRNLSRAWRGEAVTFILQFAVLPGRRPQICHSGYSAGSVRRGSRSSQVTTGPSADMVVSNWNGYRKVFTWNHSFDVMRLRSPSSE